MARSGRRNLVVQNSPLLSLPAELRNMVYEYAAQNTESISVRHDGILYRPALSLVCRQVREEYRLIHLEEAAYYASRVHVHITNFVYRRPMFGDVNSPTSYLPPSLSSSGPRRNVTLRIRLTNFWDRHRLDLRKLMDSWSDILQYLHGGCYSKQDSLGVEVRWDPKTFDVNYLREDLPKLKFCHGRASVWEVKHAAWVQLEKAFNEALVRYSPKTPTKSPKRKRKRQSEDGARTGETKRRRKGV